MADRTKRPPLHQSLYTLDLGVLNRYYVGHGKDYHLTIAALIREVEDLRARVEVLEWERGDGPH